MNNTRNMLIIGRTGNGKSALANVISGTDEFKEVEFGVSGTKRIQTGEFEHQGVKYRLIDTVGIGDTKMPLRRVLYSLAKASSIVKDGLSQILLITDGKLSKEAKSTYTLLEKVIFDENIVNYTTIVRTKFDNFEDEAKCQEDKQKLIASSGEFKEMIEKCSDRIIHVDNPPLTGRSVAINQETREDSREILLNHLETCQAVYKPKNLEELNNQINKYVVEEKRLQEEEEGKIFIEEVAGTKITGDKIRKEKRKIVRGFIQHIQKIDPDLKEEIKKELEQVLSEVQAEIEDKVDQAEAKIEDKAKEKGFILTFS